ncbi:O-antigen ligase family protein [Anoxybacillus ayderensis]|uniref:O-antigen ligase family protein n=1 Tax=Anoxybacillus ayderensis TaxID=265546 RepID=UPI000A26A7CC|nr:O-antigen ligase family protein [Anoxybacillus ayderensis]OSX53999.1 hypothetical protein B7H16_08740 [Anoxybacillus ayderensis]
MNKGVLITKCIAFLIFFDFLFFNIRVIFFNFTLLLVILLGLFFILIAKQIGSKNLIISSSRYINSVLLFFIVWIVYGILQITWAIDRTSAIRQVYYLGIFFVLIYVILIFLNSKYIFTKLNKFLYYMATFFIIFGVMELNFDIHFPSSRVINKPELYYNIKRTTAVFYNENDFSFYLALITPMFLLNILYKKGIKKLLNILVVGMIFYIVIANDSMACLMALLIEIIALMFLVGRKKIASFFLGVVIVCSLLFFQQKYLQDSYDLVKQELYHQSGSAAVREKLFFSGLELLKRSYFLGVGPGNFEANIYAITYGKGIDGIVNAHNWLIELSANYGLIIFLMYLLIFFYMLIHLNKIRKSGERIYSFYGTYFLTSYVGFIISSMSSSSIFYNWYQWLHFASAISLINIFSKDQLKS